MTNWLDEIRRDAQLAIRRARRHKTFTVVVIACVALGVGATAGVFSVLRPVLLKPVPFEEPERLMRVAAYSTSRADPDERYWMSWIPTEQLILSGRSLEGLAGFYRIDFDVLDADGVERIPGAQTLAGSFDALRVRPVLGRSLRADDVRAGLRTALISEELWARRYARDANVLGQVITLNEQPHEIIGVIPAGYRFPNRAEIWAAYHPDDYTLSEQRGTGNLQLVGRLAAGSTDVDLERDLATALRATKEIDPIFYSAWGLESISLRRALVGDFERPLWALFGGAALVLLLAVANVVNLLMARAQGEEWERALRIALGVRRARMLQQRFVENVLLTAAGATAGIVLAVWGTRALLAVTPLNDPAFDRVGLSPLVIVVAAGLAALVAATMSAFTAGGGSGALAALRGSRAGQSGLRDKRVQSVLVVGQIALSLVLLVGAGLFGKSFTNLQSLDLGFDTEPLVAIRVSAPPSLVGTPNGPADFARDVIGRVAAIPGVEAIGAVSGVPFDDPNVGYNHSIEDFPPEDGSQRSLAPGWVISPGYFASMGIEVLRGRDFVDADRMEAPPVAIVNREFERQRWPGGSALGKRIKRGAYAMDRPWIEIVGVVEDSRAGTLSDAVQPHLYYPVGQSQGSYLAQMAYTVRYRGNLAQVVSAFRAAVAEAAPAATVYRVSTGSDITRVALGRPKFNGLIIGAFALAGLVLAAAGVYGVTAYTVGRRTREFGVRVALGAEPRQVCALVVRHGAVVAAIGVALGLSVTTVLSGTLGALLYEVDPRDVSTYTAVTALLVGTVLLASYLPARRATRVDPTVALREE
jgi:predicted permease